MSKTKPKRHTLGLRQRSIVVCLAEKGEQTINKLAKNMKADYKSTNQAVHSLEEQGLLEKESTIIYNGQTFAQLWLTKEGILEALLLEANPTKLIENNKKLKTKGDFALVTVFANLLKDAPSSAKVQLKEMIAFMKALGKDIDLKRKLTPNENQKTDEFLDNVTKEHPEMKDFFDSYFKMRSIIKGQREENDS